jgi:hypothetical protein
MCVFLILGVGVYTTKSPLRGHGEKNGRRNSEVV